MKYLGYWRTADGTGNLVGYQSNNWKELRKTLREICNGNLHGITDTATWEIRDARENFVMYHGRVTW